MIFAKKNSSQLSFQTGRRVKLVWLTFLLGWLGISLVGSQVCLAHVYKDGFVERSLAITIRGESGHAELLIGLNEKTAASILADAQLKKSRSASKAVGTGQAKTLPSFSRKQKQKTDKGSGGGQSNQKKTAPDLPNKSNQTGPVNKSGINRDGGVQRLSEGQHLTDPAMIKRLAALKEIWAIEKLKLTLDGRRIELKNVSVSPAPRHPYSLVVKFDFALQKSDSSLGPASISDQIDFRLVDETFPKQNGAVRYALRSRGSTILLKSNVVPVIVRAERFEFEKTRGKIDSKSFTIDAKLIVDR